MSIYKREGVYYFNFWWNKRHVQRSTKQGNPRVARQMEAAHRTALAKGEVGIEERMPVPTLRDFMQREFLPWIDATFSAKPKTFSWYRGGVRRLSEFEPLASLQMDKIAGDKITGYVAYRQAKGLSITGINRELQILRRVLRIAVEWGRVARAVKVRMLPGEARRERVLTLEEEYRYLAVTSEPLLAVVTVLVDSGMRPEECFRLLWSNVSFETGKYGTLHVTHGKTAAARRFLPMTRRVRLVMESMWHKASKPDEGWVFSAPTKSGHIEPSTIRGLHRRALESSHVKEFVLYTLRHTFLTRLGASGCDAWTLARIAGHSSVAISGRYVHPSEDAVLGAFERLHGEPENCCLSGRSKGVGGVVGLV